MSAPTTTNTRATQGHRYRIRVGPNEGVEVLCVEGGVFPRVAIIYEWFFYPLGPSFFMNASSLQPLPMRYFNGEMPR